MKYIKTGQTRSDVKRQWLVMVDDEDYEFLNQYRWQADKYSSVATHRDGERKRTLIHRLIMKPEKGVEIDHIDGNRLNNQKSNLRFATSSQNKINRGPRKDNKSGFKGVSWHKQRNLWTARIMADGKYKHLGLFKTPKEAAKAYNAEATTITLPTGTLLGAALGATQGTIFDLYIDNTAGANTVTIAVATNGILSTAADDTAGSFGDLTVASGVTGVGRFTLMFSSATAYVFTRTG